jgi:hypothetical protein
MEHVWAGENLMFTFKSEAIQFAEINDLKIVYNDGEMLDSEHFDIIGYKSKLYWIAP